jgi:carboxyl-terminal processing protease
MFSKDRSIVFGLLAIALTAIVCAGLAWAQASATVEEKVGRIVAEMEKAQTKADLWNGSAKIEQLGRAAVPALKKVLTGVSPGVRLGCAKALIALDERKAGLEAVFQILKVSKDRKVRVLAADLLYRSGARRSELEDLEKILPDVLDPYVKIGLAKVLRNQEILKKYLGSGDFSVQSEAALALGELCNVEAAKAILDRLKLEPTKRGRLARALLEKEELYKQAELSRGLQKDTLVRLQEKKIKELEERVKFLRRKLEEGGSLGQDLLDEIRRDIKLFYVDGEKTEDKKLIDAAAKGMARSLDDFSSYMTEEETKQFNQEISQQYEGIGAVVQIDPKDKWLTIVKPIYSGPAYKAGLRSRDKIIKVEGIPTKGKTVQELVRKLKGPAGTEVHIEVWRKGWKKEKPYTLKRERIELKSVLYDMLPGKIGYVRLAQFGEKAVREVEDALKDLETQGLKALILDLRGNPGGLLQAAKDISDKFLGAGKLIVSSKGRHPIKGRERKLMTTQAATHPGYPMVILIDGFSASASEIVAGAMQDHKRAVLVGMKTFGKGSVQEVIPLQATNYKSRLRITIAKYYLPSGRSIAKVGVQPDIEIDFPDKEAWKDEEAEKLIESQAIEKYLDTHYKKNQKLFHRLAHFDNFDENRYPDFKRWLESVKTKLEPDDVRRLIRAYTRRLAQDDRGREFAADIEEDIQLQRAVYELLQKMEDAPLNYNEYKHLTKKFQAKKAKAKEVFSK